MVFPGFSASTVTRIPSRLGCDESAGAPRRWGFAALCCPRLQPPGRPGATPSQHEPTGSKVEIATHWHEHTTPKTEHITPKAEHATLSIEIVPPWHEHATSHA